MKERPILFSGEMVRAILDGRKTQTRRIIKPQPITWKHDERGFEFLRTEEHRPVFADTFARNYSPYGQPGDRLWVRETVNAMFGCDAFYVVDETRLVDALGWDWVLGTKPKELPFKVIPSIHMPRWASRITLEITGVRVGRLNEISEADAAAEGVDARSGAEWDELSRDRAAREYEYRYGFKSLWQSINGDGSWALNPWVWVVEFRRVER